MGWCCGSRTRSTARSCASARGTCNDTRSWPPSPAPDLLATGARRADVVKLARLAVDGGVEVEPAVLAKAANIAFAAGDLTLTERISRRAFEPTGDYAAGWSLANAYLGLGEAEAGARTDRFVAAHGHRQRRTPGRGTGGVAARVLGGRQPGPARRRSTTLRSRYPPTTPSAATR